MAQARRGSLSKAITAAGAVSTANKGAWLYGFAMRPTDAKIGRVTLKDGSGGTVMLAIEAASVAATVAGTKEWTSGGEPLVFEDSIYAKVHNVSAAWFQYVEYPY